MKNKFEPDFFSTIPDGGGIYQKNADFGKTKYVCPQCGADVGEDDLFCENCLQPDVQESKILRSKLPKKSTYKN